MIHHGRKLTNEEEDLIFRMIDVDDDEHMSCEEFVKFVMP
jgi:Ca2+-binding EF-hand superfamily protein